MDGGRGYAGDDETDDRIGWSLANVCGRSAANEKNCVKKTQTPTCLHRFFLAYAGRNGFSRDESRDGWVSPKNTVVFVTDSRMFSGRRRGGKYKRHNVGGAKGPSGYSFVVGNVV